MNRRQLLRSAAGLPAAAAVLSAASVQQKQINITGIETDVLKRPSGSPYYDAIHAFGTGSGSVVLRIRTDAGITGWASSSFGMIAGGPRILEEEVKPVLIGKDPAFPRRSAGVPGRGRRDPVRHCRGGHRALGHPGQECESAGL